MKWLERDMSLKTRQSLDLIFWLMVFISGSMLLYSYIKNIPLLYAGILFVISFYLMYKNNKIALKQIKEKETDNKDIKN